MVGLVVGMVRMGLDFARRAPYCGSGETDERFEIVSKVDFLHFAIILAGVSTLAMVIISLFTVPREEKQVCIQRTNRGLIMKHARIQKDLSEEGPTLMFWGFF